MKKLYQNFRLSYFIRDVTIALDNLWMKTDNKINIYFTKYLF